MQQATLFEGRCACLVEIRRRCGVFRVHSESTHKSKHPRSLYAGKAGLYVTQTSGRPARAEQAFDVDRQSLNKDERSEVYFFVFFLRVRLGLVTSPTPSVTASP